MFPFISRVWGGLDGGRGGWSAEHLFIICLGGVCGGGVNPSTIFFPCVVEHC